MQRDRIFDTLTPIERWQAAWFINTHFTLKALHGVVLLYLYLLMDLTTIYETYRLTRDHLCTRPLRQTHMCLHILVNR